MKTLKRRAGTGNSDKPSKPSKSPTFEAAPMEMGEAPQRNLLQEGRDALTLMNEAGPQLVNWYKQYGPQFALAEEATARARGKAEIAGAQLLGPKIRAALLNASPTMKLADAAMQKQLKSMGPSAIETELTRQATEDLKLGGQLSADQLREVSQGSRAAFASRGLGRGMPAAVSEVMSRSNASDARKAQRQQAAGAIDAYTQNRVSNDRQYTTNALTTSAAIYDPFQRLYGHGGSQQSGQIGANNLYAPYLGAAQNVGAGNQQAATQWGIAGMQESGQNARFGQQMAWDQYQFGQNMDYQRWASGQNRTNALLGGGLQLAGSLGGAAIIGAMI